MQSKILVIGASRGIGLATVKRCLLQGYAVRAFARGADAIRLSDAHLEKRSGDALERAAVDAALDGCSAVIQALGIPMNLRMLRGPITLFSHATEVLIPAMQAAGVKRLITVTGFGAGDSRARIPPLQRLGFDLVFRHAYRDKDVQEQLIRDSDLDWTIVRPGVLTNGRRTGDYQVLADPRDWRNGLISRADVADFLVRQIDDTTYIHKTPVLRG